MFKKTLYTLTILSLVCSQIVFAFQPKETTLYFNSPTVSAIGSTSAILSLSQAVLSDLTEEEKQGIYFKYRETHQVCIMIYPTPEYCLPKKTEVGKTEATLSGLKPNTSYTVTYVRDNTIMCITTPCPQNGFESLSVEFTTKKEGTVVPSIEITKNLWYGSRGSQVTALQNILIQQGYLKTSATGYFGVLTLQAVKKFQKANNIIPTGFVGPLTRAVLTKMLFSSSVSAETFEGTITAYSNQCFVDGECSISVDGKKIITTTGRSQEVLGKVIGIPDFSALEKKIGTHAKVYAKKTVDGYTLYGSTEYYIEVK